MGCKIRIVSGRSLCGVNQVGVAKKSFGGNNGRRSFGKGKEVRWWKELEGRVTRTDGGRSSRGGKTAGSRSLGEG